MKQEDGEALKGIRSLAFELVKNSEDKERKFNIEDQGDHCTIQLTVRVIAPEFQSRVDRINATRQTQVDL